MEVFRRVFSGGVFLLAMLAGGCTHLGILSFTDRASEGPESFEPHEIQQSFVPIGGMTRNQVESILGEPDHSGRTKEGLHLLVWRVEWEKPREGRDPVRMRHHQSIEFDGDWRVVRAYRQGEGVQ